MGEGPFLWLSEQGSPWGYGRVPTGGMCLSAFLFVQRDGQLLLGRYADDPAWEQLAGLDAKRRQVHGQGWTLPASHLRFGEDPREAGERIARDILGLDGLTLSEPRVFTAYDDFPGRPGLPPIKDHYDVWFFLDATLASDQEVDRPAWYEALAFHDPRALPDDAYARFHHEMVAKWLAAAQ